MAADGSPARTRPVGVRTADAAWLAAAVGALLVYWFGRVLPGVDTKFSFAGTDLPFQFLPDYVYLADRLRAGELPQWNPFHGQPFLATLLPGAFYPARLLLLAFDVPTAMHVSTLLHLAVSLGATFVLCRSLGIGVLGAFVGGVAFMGVHALPALYWPPFLEAGAWLPLAALSLVRLAATGSWRWSVALGTSCGMIVLAGAYQHALYTGYALAVLAIALLVDPARRGVLLRPAMAPRLAAAVALAVATAAPQAIPSLVWSAGTIRSGAPLTDAQLDPYPMPWLVFAKMFRGSGRDELMFVGVPIAALALLGGVTRRWFGAVLLAALLLTVAMTLGRGAPAFGLFHVLPGFSSFRIPDRLIFLVAFFAAVTAALGIDLLARRGRVAHAVAAIAAAAAVASLLVPRRIASALPWTIPPAAIAGPPALMALVERHTDGGRTLLTGTGHHDGIAVKQTGLRRVRNLEDYNPLTSRRLATYLHAIVGHPPPGLEATTLFVGFIPMNEPIVHPELLDMASVRTVLVKSFVRMPQRQPPFRPLGRAGAWTLYENPLALPRTFTVEHARFVADDDEALAAVQAPGFDPRRETVLVGTAEGADAVARTAGTGTMREARIVRDLPEQVTVDVHTDRPAVLVLTDPFAPGWTATVDGRPVPVLPANHLGRGVVLPAGASRVDFAYRAPGLRAGVALWLAGWGTLGAAVTWRAWRRSRQARPSPGS